MKNTLFNLASDVYAFTYNLDPYAMDTDEDLLPYIASDIMHGAEMFTGYYEGIMSLRDEYSASDIKTAEDLMNRISALRAVLESGKAGGFNRTHITIERETLSDRGTVICSSGNSFEGKNSSWWISSENHETAKDIICEYATILNDASDGQYGYGVDCSYTFGCGHTYTGHDRLITKR